MVRDAIFSIVFIAAIGPVLAQQPNSTSSACRAPGIGAGECSDNSRPCGGFSEVAGRLADQQANWIRGV